MSYNGKNQNSGDPLFALFIVVVMKFLALKTLFILSVVVLSVTPAFAQSNGDGFGEIVDGLQRPVLIDLAVHRIPGNEKVR